MSQDEAVALWLEGARKALRAAQLLHEDHNDELALFHCHLCAEKVLKGLYVSRKNDAPPMTHDLTTLVAALNDPQLQEKFDDFKSMSKFAIAARYDDLDVLEEDMTEERIAHWISFSDSLLQYAQDK